MKKAAKMLALFCTILAILAGTFFGVRQLNRSKNTVKVSVTDLGREGGRAAGQLEQGTVSPLAEGEKEKPQEELINTEQQPKEEISVGVAAQSPVVTKKDVEKKQETTDEKIVAEDKAVPAGKIVQRLISWGFTKAIDRKIDTVIIHSSYDALGKDPYSVAGIIEEYRQYGVSAHYLLSRDGTIYQLVTEQNIAWHAGVSTVPDGRKNVNDFSIGIEMINTQDGEYTDAQYSALNSLLSTLKKKYEIKYILGHAEIAPGRKTDPWGISWKKVNR